MWTHGTCQCVRRVFKIIGVHAKFKQSHKRPRADEDGARELRGIPSHEFGLPHAQVLSGLGFAECLCGKFDLGLVTDVDARHLSVRAKGV